MNKKTKAFFDAILFFIKIIGFIALVFTGCSLIILLIKTLDGGNCAKYEDQPCHEELCIDNGQTSHGSSTCRKKMIIKGTCQVCVQLNNGLVLLPDGGFDKIEIVDAGSSILDAGTINPDAGKECIQFDILKNGDAGVCMFFKGQEFERDWFNAEVVIRGL